jgi:hypothetical protein
LSSDVQSLWEACRADFDSDGSPRSVYVFDTAEEDWDTLLRALARGRWRPSFWIDGFLAPLPRYGIEAFAVWRENEPLLELAVGPLELRCHFHSALQLELDFDPAGVRDRAGLEALLRFMAWLAGLLDRPARLAPEGAPERPILDVSPHGRVRFHPLAG